MTFTNDDRPTPARPSALFPVEPILGESLMGLVLRAAADNIHLSTATILAAAGQPHHAAYDLAISRPELLPDLAEALGANTASVIQAAHPRFKHPDKLPLVEFFGTPVARNDLGFRARRVAPRSLASSSHHRALWAHWLVPYCTETGSWIVSSCPACGAKLGWSRAVGPERCDVCEAVLSDHDVGGPDQSVRALVDPVLDLLAPEPERHVPALARLHADYHKLDRGDAFELGWRLARALDAAATPLSRDRHCSLPLEEKMKALVGAAHLLAGGVASIGAKLTEIGRDLGLDALMKVIDRLRRDNTARRSWPSLRNFLREALPDIFDPATSTRSALAATLPGHVDGSSATLRLGAGSHRFVDLRRAGFIEPLVYGGGDVNEFALFDGDALDLAAEILRDRMSGESAGEGLGISLHGVEQAVCLKLLPAIDNAIVRHAYPGLQISRAGFDALQACLASVASSEPGFVVPLRIALKGLGGRDKPWGPILASMLAGQLPFALSPKEGPLASRVLLRLEDSAKPASFSFDLAAYAAFPFSDTMTRRDAQEVLNLTPHGMVGALRTELSGASARGKRLQRKHVLDLARKRVSGGELRSRWLGGSRKLPGELKTGGRLSRCGVTGWRRDALERFFEGAS